MISQVNLERTSAGPLTRIPTVLAAWKKKAHPALKNFASNLPKFVLVPLGLGTDVISVATATSPLNEEPSIQKLLHLNILWPERVDRVCAEQTRTQFLIADFLPAKSIAIAAGESTIGKSALICQLALCIATGVPFLGMGVEQGRVLYFDLENSLFDCKRMRDSLLRHLNIDELPSNFLLTQDPSVDLDRALEIARPRLVIVDSLRSFRPDVTDKNRAAGEWLQALRKLCRTHDCGFLIVHHLRKPGENAPVKLEDSTVSTWLQEMEGPRGFFNQTDVRIAIDEADGRANDTSSLKMKWVTRVYGESPVISIERVFNEDDEPLGYRHLTGVSLLEARKRAAFDTLPAEFSTADARAARGAQGLGDGNDPTNKFLAECRQLRIVEKLGRGRWRKSTG